MRVVRLRFRCCIPGVRQCATSELPSSPMRSSTFWGYLAGLSIFPVVIYSFFPSTPGEGETTVGVDMKAAREGQSNRVVLGGAFTATDAATLARVTNDTVFRGRWSMLYFGFTHCTEVCPNTMKFLSGVVEALASCSGERPNIQTVFYSVDYIRDTPVVTHKFCQRFPSCHPVGLCGTRHDVTQATSAWRVYYTTYDESEDEKAARLEKGLPEPVLDENYQFDHSSAIYLVGPDGKLKDFFFKEMGVENAVERIGLHLSDGYGLNS